jgi:hypothetical protein
MHYVILFALSAPLAAAPVAAARLPRELKPVMVWTGTDSRQAAEAYSRCGSQKDWEAVWHKHKSGGLRADRRTCPEVDFDSYLVLAIFYGKSSEKGIQVVAVVEEARCIRVRYRPVWYQTGYVAPAAGATPFSTGRRGGGKNSHDTQSYAFVILPQSQKPIVVEEDVRRLLIDPPVWKERARLSAADQK